MTVLPFNALFAQNFVLVYFFYGLAFFCMGLAILLERRRTSTWPLADALVALAAFGIIHGLHEWFEMFQLLERAGATNVPGWLLLEPVRIIHLVSSFAFLAVFGVQLIVTNRTQTASARALALGAGGLLVTVWLVAWRLTIAQFPVDDTTSIAVADVLARYMLGIPGSVLATWAIWLEQRAFRERGMAQFGRALLLAGVALTVYGVVGQLFTRPTFLFPSNVINADLFLAVTGVPVQLFRAMLAILMAVGIVGALRVFDVEQQQQLERAQAEQKAAQARQLAVQSAARTATERANRELQAAVGNLTSLNRLSYQLAATLDEAELLHVVFPRFIAREDAVGAGMIMTVVVDGPPAVVAKTECPTPPAYREAMERLAQQVGRHVITHIEPAAWDGTSIVSLPERIDAAAEYPWGANEAEVRILGFPLLRQGIVYGAMMICTAPDAAPFSPQTYTLFSTAARQVGAALTNAALYGELQARDAVRRELLRQIVSAQEHERQRIARELHDGPGQTLTALGLGLAASSENVLRDPSIARRQLSQLKTLSAGALQELRDIIADLRPSLLDDLGLVPAVRSQAQLLEARSATGVTVVVDGERRRLDPEVETIVFRVVQEALTNIAKHAQADRAEVRLRYGDDALTVTISDDGRGFETADTLTPPQPGHEGWGLLGMRERVTLAGGSWRIAAEPGRGTTIDVRIPLQ